MAGLLDSGTNLSQTSAQGSNPLDQFQTFNNLFTLASLSRGQINGNVSKDSLTNIICRSQSVGDKGVQTDFGTFDYFIDDVTIVTIPSASKLTGNTFATKISFKVHEPYSMGLFMLALRNAASASGYPQNFNQAPYAFMIEWVGYVNNKPGAVGDRLTRIIPIRLSKVTFKVGMTGSVYDCEAIPYNEIAFREDVVKHVTDVQISGETVQEILLTGPTSLVNQLQVKWTHDKELHHIDNHDFLTIAFPKNFQDSGGTANSTGQNKSNPIGESKLYTQLNTSGVQPFQDLPQIFDEVKHILKSPSFKLDEKRVWHFTQEVSIVDIITEVILRSEYISNQIVGGKFSPDSTGMVNWFRIEPYVMDGAHNEQLGRQQRTIIYRVVPYRIHVGKFLPPGTQPKGGFSGLKNTVSRVYNYIYTGKNTEILNLELQFNMAYFTPVPSDATYNVGQNNPGQANILAGGKDANYAFPNGNFMYDFGQATQLANSLRNFTNSSTFPFGQLTAASNTFNTLQQLSQSAGGSSNNSDGELVPTAVPAAQKQFFYKAPGGSGADKPETSQVRVMNYLLTNQGDMVNLSMEIMGDPYYIPTSGMGNQIVAPEGQNELKDGSMNYQDSEVHFIVNFRTPVDFDTKKGMYRFEKGIDMWSGLYHLTQIESRFSGNKFTQIIKGYRLRSQLGGKSAESTILKEEQQGQSGQRGGQSRGDNSYGAGLLNPDSGSNYENGAGPNSSVFGGTPLGGGGGGGGFGPGAGGTPAPRGPNLPEIGGNIPLPSDPGPTFPNPFKPR